ncbi:MAG: pirin family protein [Deltaproteobacteria bacterium]|nr:pirin family protein [Deltaproteobacteria bacterium]MBW2418117.1 pirin family protein [Deltaproteobacteria bacterium]
MQNAIDRALPELRQIETAVAATPVVDGAGVPLARVVGTSSLPLVDPFLLLDEIGSDEPQAHGAGFPDHPHRGFETVSYMLRGRMRHTDHAGHAGVVEAGGVQWMSAGRGIVHSEMPEPVRDRLWGFQLWVNLPAARKLAEPRYQEFNADSVVEEARSPSTLVRVIAGTTSLGSEGPVRGISTDPRFFDVRMKPGGRFAEEIPRGHNVLVHVYRGSVELGAAELQTGNAAVLGAGERVELRAGERGGELLLLAGRPLNEPVVRAGPFVMNTRDELLQAFRDFSG